VKILGWGYDEKTKWDYYLIQNSWGTKWGDKGYFKIKVGECSIDKEAYYCDPIMNQF
jgi:C1A family cysteine protease